MLFSLSHLPAPPPECTGWPWTEASVLLPSTRPDGSPWPRITIVTPSFNQGSFIEETIRSVLLQGYPNVQYIVMDGGSTDETISILEKYSPFIGHWESLRDGGQADAINRGLAIADGIWFQNINSDDVLLPGALTNVGDADQTFDVVCGNVVEFHPDGFEYVVSNIGITVPDLLRRYWRTDRHSWHQPGSFLKTEMIKQIGGYDTEFHYTFDLHLMIRYAELYGKILYTDNSLVKFRIHPGSKSSSWKDVYAVEEIAIRERLAAQLAVPEHRIMAGREASRRRMAQAIGKLDKTDTQERIQLARDILRAVGRHPRLAFDRMLLGSIRRSPGLWSRACIGR